MVAYTQADSAAGSALLSILGLNLQDTTAQLGLGCSPISAVGVGSGNACEAQTVCCENNNVVSAHSYSLDVKWVLTRDVDAGRRCVHWLLTRVALSGGAVGGYFMVPDSA